MKIYFEILSSFDTGILSLYQLTFLNTHLSITEIKNTSSKLQMGSQGTIRKCEADFQINQLSKNKLSDHKFKILLI